MPPGYMTVLDVACAVIIRAKFDATLIASLLLVDFGAPLDGQREPGAGGYAAYPHSTCAGFPPSGS